MAPYIEVCNNTIELPKEKVYKPTTPNLPTRIPIWKRSSSSQSPKRKAKTPDPKSPKGQPKRGQPPLPKLNSLKVTAMIMSFAFNRYQVKLLFNRLSKNTGCYFSKHHKILSGCMTPYRELLEYGDRKVQWTNEYPNDEQIAEMSDKVKLKAIQLTNTNIRGHVRDFLVAIRLYFSNGEQSPLYEVKPKEENEKREDDTFQINTKQEISKISVI